jgi:rhodanese-related sulfurtransferase
MLFTRKPSITAEQASAGVADRELVLVDVRQPAELRHGRAPR